jgi:transcriptional regulator with XRE-family HTH domain
MAEKDPERRHFAALLKAFREARGLTRAEFGARCGYAESTIKSFETGQRAVFPYQARHFDEAFGLDGIFEHEASRFDKAGVTAAYGAFVDAMREADDVYWFEHSWVHGLFQTERYARAVLSTYPGVKPEQVNERVAARLARQELLDRSPEPLRVWALLDESALRRRVGDAAVMHEQLMHLAKVSERPDVSIQILPGLDGHPGMLGAFIVAVRRGQPSIVYTQATASGSVTDDPAMEQQVMLIFRSLQTTALPVDASRDTIAKVADEQWKVPARTGARALTAVPTEDSV